MKLFYVVLLLGSSILRGADSARPNVDWPNYAGDKGGSRYSPLDQINRSNVSRLEVAWTYHTGEKTKDAPIECTPIVINGIMYLTSAQSRVIALDAATGHPLWVFNPHANMQVPGYTVNRGVAHWTDAKKPGTARIVLATPDGRLFSVDARTGTPDAAFGKNGVVDLKADMDRDLTALSYGVTSAPMVFEDLVILGFTNGEGPEPSSPGDIRAFDIHTGREAWRFHTVPRPGEFGHEMWQGDSWKDRGGANAWGGVSVDAKRGLVFAGLGSVAFDFYGGDRKGTNLFANSVIALDARTGKRLWHFQTVRHDLQDHDLPTFPVAGTIQRNGRAEDIVAQVTKTGYVFVLDRVTGKPVFGVEERAAPKSDVPGEESWPMQVYPLKPPPFSRQTMTEDDITNISKEAHDYVLEQFRKLRTGPIYTPPSLEGTVIIPGFHGGATWSGASFDPATGILYVNSNNVPNLLQLIKVSGKPYPYRINGYKRFTDQDGHPAVKPPWGNLTAIDLNRGEFVWQIALGDDPDLKARGITGTGSENFGGTIVTAGGLVFIGGTRDEMFRAFDKTTGKLLWEHQLDAGGYATPCAYSVNGRQYVAIAAGGGGKLGTKTADTFVAFALKAQ